MKYTLVAIQLPDGVVTEEIIQSAFEEFGDLEPSDFTVIDGSYVPDSAYRMEWDA